MVSGAANLPIVKFLGELRQAGVASPRSRSAASEAESSLRILAIPLSPAHWTVS